MESDNLPPPTLVEAVEQISEKDYKLSVFTTISNSSLLTWLPRLANANEVVLITQSTIMASGLNQNLESESVELANKLALESFIRSQHCLLRRIEGRFWEYRSNLVTIGFTMRQGTTKNEESDDQSYVSIMNTHRIITYKIMLTDSQRTKEEQDYVLSLITIKLVSMFVKEENCSLKGLSEDYSEKVSIVLLQKIDPLELITQQLRMQEIVSSLVFLPKGGWIMNLQFDGFALFPGSFNPVHEGHIEVAKRSAELLGIPECMVVFEISLTNPDKGIVTMKDYLSRVQRLLKIDRCAMITQKGYISDKNCFMKNGFILMGADTLKRVLQKQRDTDSDEQLLRRLEEFSLRNNKIIVAPRKDPDSGLLVTKAELEFPSIPQEVILELSGFRLDASSTEIRQKR